MEQTVITTHKRWIRLLSVKPEKICKQSRIPLSLQSFLRPLSEKFAVMKLQFSEQQQRTDYPK